MSFCHLIAIRFPSHPKTLCWSSAPMCFFHIKLPGTFSVWQGHILLACSVHPPHPPNQDGYRRWASPRCLNAPSNTEAPSDSCLIMPCCCNKWGDRRVDLSSMEQKNNSFFLARKYLIISLRYLSTLIIFHKTAVVQNILSLQKKNTLLNGPYPRCI